MTVEEFQRLPDKGKKELLVDAIKITEYEDNFAKHELFQIDNFFVEVSISVIYKFRRIENTFSLKDVPLLYAEQVNSRHVKTA
jgi:hypothetical protein